MRSTVASNAWGRAAAVAAHSLRGSLYERYYDLPAVTELVDAGEDRPSTSKQWQPVLAEQFAKLCSDRSREAHLGDGGFVARNGTVIEQSQILTTHNLAPLVEGLELRPQLEPQAGQLADRCFEWLVRTSAIETTNWRAQMQSTKNAAFALRQAIYFLSLCPDDEMRSVVSGLRAHASAERNSAWRRRFEPVVAGVEAVAAGNRFGADGQLGDGRRLLGWTVGRHWLLP